MPGVVLGWPDKDRVPEPARTALMGPGAPFELAEEEVLGTKIEVFPQRVHDLRALLVSGG